MSTVAFDVDGCLIDQADQPRWEIVALLRTLALTSEIIVWSGGGEGYAALWGRRLFLPDKVEYRTKPIGKFDEIMATEYAVLGLNKVDLCFDDMNVDYGRVNVRV